MISHRKRFIFVHIPKTGGTSVAWALRRHGFYLQGKQNYDSLYFKHVTACDLQRMLGDDFRNYFRFAVVRNPWDWAVSNYAFNRGLSLPFVRGTEHEVSVGVPAWAADWDFKRWLKWWTSTLAPSQTAMLTDTAGRLLVDRVIRFEELDREFLRLCLRLRVWPRRLLHANPTENRRGHAEYYDDESRALVARHFAEDIRRFGYAFDGLLPR